MRACGNWSVQLCFHTGYSGKSAHFRHADRLRRPIGGPRSRAAYARGRESLGDRGARLSNAVGRLADRDGSGIKTSVDVSLGDEMKPNE